eukprot:gene6043-2654_t
MAPTGKIRWGDTLDDDDTLPPSSTKGPDDNGVKTVTEYYRNDKGDAFKKTQKLKTYTVEKKVYSVSEQRKNMVRFGAAAKEKPTDSITIRTNDEIPFERVRQQKATTMEKKELLDMQQVLASKSNIEIAGSLKDFLSKKRMERELMRAKGLMSAAEKAPEDGDSTTSSLPAAGAKSGSYVPPSRRGGTGSTMDGDSMHNKRREENSLRVTNLSEDVSEADLMELFRPFGHVSRAYVAVDRVTGENRGFAFVNFSYKEEAERAMRALNGYGYDNLILRVEWAAPREARH